MFGLQRSYVTFGVVEKGQQRSKNGFICAKKIEERHRQDEDQTCQKSQRQKHNLHIGNKFYVMCKLVAPDQKKNQEYQGNHTVVDTIFQERKLGGSKKSKVAAEYNKSGDVPGHDKNANRHSHQCGTERVYISEVFGSQEKRFGSKALHQYATDACKQNNPEY